MPAQDTTYIDKLIDAGIAPEYYRGTYINFTVEESDDKPGDMIIYFVNNKCIISSFVKTSSFSTNKP